MTTLPITETVLATLRQRRLAGQSIKAMAAEVGITWQKLDKAIRHGIRRQVDPMTIPANGQAQDASQTLPQPAPGTGPLVDRYRPRTLAAIVGQDDLVAQLRAFVANPCPAAFLFEGETGTGKSSAALALAGELGCDLSQKPPEFGGLHIIASGEQTADTVRDIYQQMWHCPFTGSGWKVLIVNEADRMHVQAETIWLDRLESLPPKTVIVFTTNFPEKLSPRFRDRCTRLAFQSDAAKLARSARKLLATIWQRETGQVVEPSSFSHIVDQATENGRLSFRRAVQLLAPLVQTQKRGAL